MEIDVTDYTLEENQTRLKELLRHESLLVTFTKKDGTERKIYCTLSESNTPKKEATSSRVISATSLPVYDLEKGEWRSFRWDSITKVEKFKFAINKVK